MVPALLRRLLAVALFMVVFSGPLYAQEPAEEPAEESAEPAEEPAEESAEEPAEESTEPAEESAGEPVEESAEEPAEESAKESAEEPAEESARDPQKEKARKVLQIVQDANDEFDRGEYDDAKRLYEEAYEMYPETVLLYRIGLAAEKGGDRREAVESFEAFVEASDPNDPTAKKVERRLSDLRATLSPRVTVVSKPPGAAVHLNEVESEPLGTTPGQFDVPAGTITLIVRAEGYKVERRELQTENGRDEILEVELSSLKRLDGEGSAEPRAGTDSGEGVNLALWGWIATGTGVALIGTGVALSVLSSSATNEVNSYDKRAPDASREELQDIKDRATTLYESSVATYIVGGVLVAAGGTLLLIDYLTDTDARAWVPSVGAHRDGAWVGLTGRF